jgi:hypothetical protein
MQVTNTFPFASPRRERPTSWGEEPFEKLITLSNVEVPTKSKEKSGPKGALDSLMPHLLGRGRGSRIIRFSNSRILQFSPSVVL